MARSPLCRADSVLLFVMPTAWDRHKVLAAVKELVSTSCLILQQSLSTGTQVNAEVSVHVNDIIAFLGEMKAICLMTLVMSRRVQQCWQL